MNPEFGVTNDAHAPGCFYPEGGGPPGHIVYAAYPSVSGLDYGPIAAAFSTLETAAGSGGYSFPDPAAAAALYGGIVDTQLHYSAARERWPSLADAPSAASFAATSGDARAAPMYGVCAPDVAAAAATFGVGSDMRCSGLHADDDAAGDKPKRRRIATIAQRRAANIRERKRMFNLNEAFDVLRSKVKGLTHSNDYYIEVVS